jgi:hypothetical protein
MRNPLSFAKLKGPSPARAFLVAWLAVLCLALPSFFAKARDGDDGWEFLTEKNGVHIWKREMEGKSMPGFRGQTHIKAPVDEVLHVMMDSTKHTEWMYACVESSIVKQLAPEHALMYNRVGAPWPVWDRDVIADTRVERYPEKKHIIATFRNVASELRPVPHRVVRLPLLVGFYKLWEVEPGKTKILYQLEADLGGSIPRWLAIAGARDMPYMTLNSLRERVESKH